MNMKRVRCCILIILMIVMTILYSNAETALPKKGDIAWLMKLYGFNIPDNVISTMHTGFSPRSYDCGEIQVNLQEILYDGI